MTKVCVVVFGAGGFIGSRLCAQLAQQKTLSSPLHHNNDMLGSLILFDKVIAHNTLLLVKRSASVGCGLDVLSVVEGDICNKSSLEDVLLHRTQGFDRVVVFNTAAVMSGPSELDFDLGMQVNLHANLHMLEVMRDLGKRMGGPQTMIFTSTDYVNCFNDRNRREPCGEEAFRLSSVSYGVQKACIELLVCDYTRKGFIDGRVLRLSTVIVKPGVFNVLSFPFHGIVSQTIAGLAYKCPLPPTAALPCAFVGHVVESLVRLATVVEGSALGHNRVVQVPADTITLAELWDSVQRVCKNKGLQIGTVEWTGPETNTSTVREINTCPVVCCDKAATVGLDMKFQIDEAVEWYLSELDTERELACAN